MEEENKILKKAGSRNPFIVPEGYFDGFTQELMNKLPEKELVSYQEPTLWQRVKPWIYMTAMFCGIMLSVKIFVGNPDKEETISISHIDANEITDEQWGAIINRSKISGYDLYQFLSDNDFESYY